MYLSRKNAALTHQYQRTAPGINQIYAAGLDVFKKEPLSADSELFRLPNVVALPHIGSAPHETRYNMAACAVDNLITAQTGKVTVNCVNPQVIKQP
ncbi:hypothetical protein I2494_07770 [Budviciaceae bacterium BWR-B9]|uniref:D-isomer specific 2-hydroxyacid dehydrogenase NAD-binding domain-containing protein n=1 Tax=Limnobaculum allomyrinae TaxID=2791986 RepID=A0ABS1IPC8_9GAMM|nr:hypothetical protein [Limnobaculum allomyrinae]MBV7692626.1 hypothetical protein [Limnobaculum sp. M2-1]